MNIEEILKCGHGIRYFANNYIQHQNIDVWWKDAMVNNITEKCFGVEFE